MKKNLIIFAVVLIAAFLCVGAVSASDGNNTTIKKTVTVSTNKKITVATAPKIIERGSKTFSSGSHRQVCNWYLIYYNKNNIEFRMFDKYQFISNRHWYTKTIISYKTTLKKYSAKGKMYSTVSLYYNGKKEDSDAYSVSKGYRTCIQQYYIDKPNLIPEVIKYVREETGYVNTIDFDYKNHGMAYVKKYYSASAIVLYLHKLGPVGPSDDYLPTNHF